MNGNAVTHVVYAWAHRSAGGAQRYLVTLMRALAGRVRLTAVLPTASDPALIDELAQLDVRLVFVPAALPEEPPTSFIVRIRDHVATWMVSWHLWRACRPLQAPGTVFHIDVLPPAHTGLLMLLASRNAVVVTLHTRLRRLSALRTVAWRLRFAALRRLPGLTIVAANTDVKTSLSTFLTGSEHSRIPVAYSPADLAEIASVRTTIATGALRASLGIAPDGLLVVTGAQFIARKGRDTWRAAAALVRRAAPEVHFLWVAPDHGAAGATPDTRAPILVLSQAELGGTRRAYLNVLAAADLFVLPSHEDGLPLAIVEAMAFGLPVISTPVNGIPEAVVDGVTGVLVPAGDPDKLAEAILELVRSPAKRAAMQAAALERVRMFDAATTVETTWAAYSAAVARVEASA